MPKIRYQEFNFGARTLETIRQAQEIVAVYAAQGYDLTLRQLYYQFVSRDLIANKQTEYKRLGSVINDARLAGLIDWEHITDRTREYEENGHAAPASQEEREPVLNVARHVETRRVVVAEVQDHGLPPSG